MWAFTAGTPFGTNQKNSTSVGGWVYNRVIREGTVIVGKLRREVMPNS
jgi:hypothetical protein